MFSQTNRRFELRALIALLVAIAFVASTFVATPQKAFAVASTDVYVHAVDENAANLSGESIKICYYGASNQVCSDPVLTNAQGNATLTVSFPSTVTYATVWAGTRTSTKWISQDQISLSNGVLVANGPTVRGSQASPIEFTQKPRYSLTGTVRVGSSSGALQNNFPLSYSYGVGNEYICENIPTNGSGTYSATNVPVAYVYFNQYACNSNSSGTTYDYIQSFSNAGTYSASATNNIVLTQTGIKVHVTDGANALVGVGIRIVSTTCQGSYCEERQAVTDANGDAVFAGLTANSSWKAAYPRYVMSNCNGCTPQIDQYQSTVNTTSKTVTTGLTADTLVLTRTAGYPETPVTVSGRVVSGPNGSETIISGAQVNMSWNARLGASNISGNATATTNSNGEYSFSNIPYGNVYISVQATTVGQTAYKGASVNQFTSQSQGSSYSGVNFNLRTEPLGNLTYSGTLKQADGTPIVGRTIYLNKMSSNSSPISPVQTGAGGAFSFTNLTAGSYYVSVDTYSDSLYQNLPWTSSSVLLTGNSTANNLVLQLKSLIAGNASANGFIGSYVDSAGESSAVGFANKSVYLYPQTGGQGFNATTAADGTWSVTGLTDGEKYWVSIQGIDYQSYEYPRSANTVTALAAGTSQHRMLYKQVSSGTGSLTGRVKNASNYSNLSGIQVDLYRELGGVSIPASTTNSRGEFSFSSLPAGDYYMQINDPNNRFKPAYMSAEIGLGANRINALLTPANNFPGSLSGEIKDERGVLLSQARIQVWDPNNSDNGGYATTNAQGQYSINGLPVDTLMNFKVSPPWDLEFDVTSDMSMVSLSEATPADVKNIQLQQAGLIAGRVSGIPATGNVPPVFVQLIDSSSGNVSATSWVDSSTGAFSIKSIRQGSYYLLFTQLARQEGYTGGGGFGASGSEGGELISLQPVYWKSGVAAGTTNKSTATTISVGLGEKIVDKTITMSRGATITGELTLETPTGITKLTGTRWVQVFVYQRQANGEYTQIGYPIGVSGYTNSQIEIAGLGAGSYKLKFVDFRKGTNSMATVFNGGASELASAPAIVVGNQQNVVVNQTMKMAAPERSAEAFALDDLGAELLGQLQNQISTDSQLAVGSQTDVYVGTEMAGEYVSAVANSTPIALGSWQQVGSDGYITVTLPADLTGSHRIAVQDANNVVVGWTAVEISDSTPVASSKRVRSNYASPESTETSGDASAGISSKSNVVAAQNSSSDSAPWQWWALGGLLLLLALITGVWAFIIRRR